jgi:molybdopterin-binding protein
MVSGYHCCVVAQATQHPAPRLLKALGDPVRFRLLSELPTEERAEVSVGELARRLGVTDTVISQHLRVLAALRLVGVQRRGRTARYFVNAAAVEGARKLLAEALPALFAPSGQERRLSARNQIFGRVVEVRRGDVNAEVGIDIGGQVVTAVITNASADRLELQPGDVAAAVFKASEVMVLK